MKDNRLYSVNIICISNNLKILESDQKIDRNIY